MKAATSDILIKRPSSATTSTSSRDYYKNLCKKLKVPMNAGILEGLIHDEIEVCFDDITPEQLPTLPKILKALKLKAIKTWSSQYEVAEFSKIGVRKGRGKKGEKKNSESAALISKQFTGISENIEKSRTMKELGIFGLNISVKTWTRLAAGLEHSKIETLSINSCNISVKEFESFFQSLGCMKSLKCLDLSNNLLKDNCGYLLGRIISRQGERRDTSRWEGGLRGSISEDPDGLCDLYLSNNSLGDYGWEKLMSSLVSDNWLRLLDCKNNNITSLSLIPTQDALQHNKTILVLDLRENSQFSEAFIKVLELVDKNFDLLDRKSKVNEKYTQLLENVCNDIPLPKVMEIKTILQAKGKTIGKSQVKVENSVEKQGNESYICKITQKCEELREENARLRRKLGKKGRKRRSAKMESTDEYIRIADKKLEEAHQVLELADEF